ncbi:MAG: type II toxin-antitoxin system ParD family antitoxin [Xanthomonadales bacterium]|nr:type II toxin-antitoxin system ParD family antitoxin [Xanthomonadales bacterium]MCB1629109.1 type II toxin-antitoxin system ParD family antitoxin [Xanthomonadales bacterium]
MPTTMNVSLSELMKAFVDEEVRDGGYVSTSDYIRDLIRQRQRAKAEAALQQAIAAGLASPAVPGGVELFEQMRARARSRDSHAQ